MGRWRPSERDLSPWNGAPNTPPRARDRAPPPKTLLQNAWMQSTCPPRLQGSRPRRRPLAGCVARRVKERGKSYRILTNSDEFGRGETTTTEGQEGQTGGERGHWWQLVCPMPFVGR